jgi:hypothetical protein
MVFLRRLMRLAHDSDWERIDDRARLKTLRQRLFQQLDGVALCGVIPALDRHDVLAEVLHSGFDVDDAALKYDANPGYLNTGLRLLASQGVLAMSCDNATSSVRYDPAPDALRGMPSSEWLALSAQYSIGRYWLEQANGMWRQPESALSTEALVAMNAVLAARSRMLDGGELRLAYHLEGALIGPWLVSLGTLAGTAPITSWTALEMLLRKMHPSRAEAFQSVLSALDWEGTAEGSFFLERSAAFGVTTSYLQTFLWAEELIWSDGGKLWRVPPGSPEIHVDRALNVWGSGGAHAAYFSHLDDVVRSIFDAPLDEQPAGLCDMGCGNGALLLHLYTFIKRETLRGRHLDTHPLTLVGADFNRAAIIATADHFEDAGVDGHFIWGDIGDPDRLDADMRQQFGIELSSLLSVRSFLDHNRVFNRPAAQRSGTPMTQGAFAFRGERLRLLDVEQSLVEHFAKWRPYVERFGLLVIELHTVNPNQAAERQGAMPATAYDATHGFSDQYIVCVPTYDAMAAEAGLHMVEECSRTFPKKLPATVSLRYFKA